MANTNSGDTQAFKDASQIYLPIHTNGESGVNLAISLSKDVLYIELVFFNQSYSS